MHEFDRLLQQMYAFQPYLEDQKMYYTYIAPKDSDKFYKFLASIYNSSATHSLYLRLSNPEVVRKLLQDLGFYDNTDLEIYISTNDRVTVQWMNKPLHQFINEKKLDFSY